MKSFGTDHNKKSLWYNTNKKLCNTIEFVYKTNGKLYHTNEIYTIQIENYKNTWHVITGTFIPKEILKYKWISNTTSVYWPHCL